MDKIQSEILTKFLGEFGVAGIYILLLCFIALIFYCFYRAGSIYFLVDRIWKITSGRDKFSNKEIDQIWNEIRDVESFQFKTRLAVNSHAQIQRIKCYVDEKNLVWRDLIPAGKHFDVKALRIRDKKYLFWGLVNSFAALLCYAFLSLPTYFYPKYNHVAYLYFKDSKIDFQYYGDKVVIKNFTIDKNKCENVDNLKKEIIVDKLKPEDINVFCKAINSEDKQYYKDTIKQQKFMVVIWMGIFILLAIILFRQAWSFFMTRELRKKIARIDKEKEEREKDEERERKIEEIYKSRN